MACYGIFWSGQLLNSVIAKYRDLSVSHIIIDLLATDNHDILLNLIQ